MRVALQSLVLALAAAAAAGQGLFDWGWRVPLDNAADWHAQPGWLGNADAEAGVVQEGEALRFSSPTPGKGMKWSLGGVNAAIPDAPYLLLEYRAVGLRTGSTDYFVYLDDGEPGETRAIRLNELVSDGNWHTLVRDLREVTASASFSAIALQLQALPDQGAQVWVRQLRQIAEPEDAPASTVPDLFLPVTETKATDWVARPTWLGNPDGEPASKVMAGVVRLTVATAGKGMKWSWALPAEVELAGHRFASFRYRVRGGSQQGDYALCVLGEPTDDGRDYTPVLESAALKTDGVWHVACTDLGSVAKRFPRIKGLAVQMQAIEAGATLEISEIGFVAERPRERASDWLAEGEPLRGTGLAPLPLPADGRATLAEALAAAKTTEWPTGQRVWHGIPFDLPATSSPVPATGVQERAETILPIGRSCSQVFALAFCLLRGAEEEVYGRNAKLSQIREIDRFRARLDYEDGSSEECMPWNVTQRGFVLRDGLQLLCFFADPTRPLRQIALQDNSPGLGLAVAAVTSCSGARAIPDPDEALPLLDERALRPRPQPPTIRLEKDVATLNLPLGTVRLGLASLPRLLAMRNDAADDDLLAGEQPQPLLAVRLNGKPVPPQDFHLAEARVGRDALALRYSCAQPVRLTLSVEIAANEHSEWGFRNVDLANGDSHEQQLAVEGPFLGPLRPGRDVTDIHYLHPRVGACLHNRPMQRRDRFGGRFPVQFMVAFSPAANSGIYLRTEAAREMREYAMGKNAEGVSFGVHYVRDLPTAPGGSVRLPTSWLGLSAGHWRPAMAAYRSWLATRYRPAAPPQQWFLEVFNFRQRFLHSHDPLYDSASGQYHLTDAVDEGMECFGGIEYLHVFDWGNVPGIGRVYGRTGDDSPFDGALKGGIPAFREAIAKVQARGVPTGLYIEGYLLQGKSKLGQAHGAEWQIIQRNHKPMYWPGSTEMMMCAAVPAWREVQASTYAARVRELGVNGMYMDQFGFANIAKDCWSPTHGHPVPGYTVESEHGLAREVRSRISSIRSGVVLYSEEVPCDQNAPLQDGSFSYHMRNCQVSRPIVPLHVPRFVYPNFKPIEILVCDHPTGGWTEGVKWTFFNGEAIWLEGPGTAWFRPETLATIRHCHAILREHRGVFSSPDVEPLVDTGAPGVFANAFRRDGQTIHTFYNARHRTFRGSIRAVPGTAQARDLWHGRDLAVTDGRISVEIPPRGVGCVLMTR